MRPLHAIPRHRLDLPSQGTPQSLDHSADPDTMHTASTDASITMNADTAVKNQSRLVVLGTDSHSSAAIPTASLRTSDPDSEAMPLPARR